MIKFVKETIILKINGAGGSRTLVQAVSKIAVYMLSLSIIFQNLVRG